MKPLPIKCYRCNQVGHRFIECPQRKTTSLVHGVESDDEQYLTSTETYLEDVELIIVDDSERAMSFIVKKLL